MRVVIADDSGLLREALGRLLTEAGIEVCAAVGDAEQLETAVAEHRPDAAVIDIRMPPTYTNEGAQAAIRLREQSTDLGILLLSQSLESRFAAIIARTNPQGFGYLLKDRVAGASTLVDALNEVTRGGTVLDPSVVSYLLGRNADQDILQGLSDRERNVLSLMAQGRSNNAISRELSVSTKTVEGHIASLFCKLGLVVEGDDNRRVLAVLRWLQPS